MFERHSVVQIKKGVRLLGQKDFGVHWKMVHTSFTKILQPKSHTQSPFTSQDETTMHLLMKGEKINVFWVVIDSILEKVKNFNLSTFAAQDRQRE